MAASNISFICKNVYATTSLKEIEAIVTQSKTYELLSDDNNKKIDEFDI